MSNTVGTPVLVEIKDNCLVKATICADALELENRFADELLNRGVEPCDADFDNGYFEHEDGTTFCLTWAYPGEDKPSGRRTL